MVRSNRPCRRLYIPADTTFMYQHYLQLYCDVYKHFRSRRRDCATDPKVSAQGLVHDEEVLKSCAESERARTAGSERVPPSSVEKNKLPGEAVREPGAMWDRCASVLPRKEPDTGCIQRGDKHHFRGDRFDLPCIPLGGAVAVGSFRVASDGRRATQLCRQ